MLSGANATAGEREEVRVRVRVRVRVKKVEVRVTLPNPNQVRRTVDALLMPCAAMLTSMLGRARCEAALTL